MCIPIACLHSCILVQPDMLLMPVMYGVHACYSLVWKATVMTRPQTWSAARQNCARASKSWSVALTQQSVFVMESGLSVCIQAVTTIGVAEHITVRCQGLFVTPADGPDR